MRPRIFASLAALLLVAVLVPTSNAQDSKPPHCTPVSLSSYAVYNEQNVRRVWDSYSVDSRGVCEWRKESGPNTMPACRHGVQLATPFFGQYGILCWWGTPATPLSTTLTPRDMQRVIEEILSIPAVKDRLGPGTLVIELQVGDHIVTIVTRDGKVATIEGKLVPPAKCYTTYLGGYREYNDPNVKRVWDEYSADSIGVCRWDVPDRPTGECNHMVEYGGGQAGIPPFWLCWWGKLVRIQQAGVNVPPDMEISMSRDCWLAIANAGSPADTLLWLYKQGNVAIKFRDPARQAAGKLAAGAVLGDVPVGRGELPQHNLSIPSLRNSAGSIFGFQMPRGDLPRFPLSTTAGVVLGDPRESGIDNALWQFSTAALLLPPPGFEHDFTGTSPPGNWTSPGGWYEQGWRWRDGGWTIIPEELRDVQVDPLPAPGEGAGWYVPPVRGPSWLRIVPTPAKEETSVLDEIHEDPSTRVLSHLDHLFRHGKEAASIPQTAGSDEWSRAGAVA